MKSENGISILCPFQIFQMFLKAVFFAFYSTEKAQRSANEISSYLWAGLHAWVCGWSYDK